MQEIRGKLRSQAGASFALALLLLLVCVVVSSVLIGASLSAMGSAAHLEQGDQRYYTVASATRLVNDYLASDKTQTVVEQRKTGDAYGAVSVQGDDPTMKVLTEYWLYGRNLESAAGTSSATNEDDWKVLNEGLYPVPALNEPIEVSLDFAPARVGSADNALKAKAVGELNPDGRLDLTLYNAYAGDEVAQRSKRFYLRVVLEPVITVEPTGREGESTEVKRATVTWRTVEASEARADDRTADA